jgi:hypothetical protein
MKNIEKEEFMENYRKRLKKMKEAEVYEEYDRVRLHLNPKAKARPEVI